MVFRQSLQHLLSKPSTLASVYRPFTIPSNVRWASVSTTMSSQSTTGPPWNSTVKPMANDSLAAYINSLRPFSAPAAPISQPLRSPLDVEEGLELTSTLRKRRLKMNKHKHKKLRKRTRALRKRLGK